MSARDGILGGLGLAGIVAAAFVPSAPTQSRADICAPGYARSRRLTPEQYYPVAHEVYRRAGIPWEDRGGYRIDHIRPLCLGGSWLYSNLHIQTIADAARKDRLEVYACRAVCRGDVALDAAAEWFKNWRVSYAHILEGAP